MMELILASNSPRRRYLLGLIGGSFRISPAHVDETPLIGESPKEYVLRLAEGKARAVGQHEEPPALVIAADTTIAIEGEILGKPGDDSEAREMLRRLKGRSHHVFTALAVLRVEDDVLYTDMCETEVPMREFSDSEIDTYVASGDPLDKAGAYAIQHTGFHPVRELTGCYANVVGLPLCHFTRTLRKLGWIPQTNVPQSCQTALKYSCPIYEVVLSDDDR